MLVALLFLFSFFTAEGTFTISETCHLSPFSVGFVVTFQIHTNITRYPLSLVTSESRATKAKQNLEAFVTNLREDLKVLSLTKGFDLYTSIGKKYLLMLPTINFYLLFF